MSRAIHILSKERTQAESFAEQAFSRRFQDLYHNTSRWGCPRLFIKQLMTPGDKPTLDHYEGYSTSLSDLFSRYQNPKLNEFYPFFILGSRGKLETTEAILFDVSKFWSILTVLALYMALSIEAPQCRNVVLFSIRIIDGTPHIVFCTFDQLYQFFQNYGSSGTSTMYKNLVERQEFETYRKTYANLEKIIDSYYKKFTGTYIISVTGELELLKDRPIESLIDYGESCITCAEQVRIGVYEVDCKDKEQRYGFALYCFIKSMISKKTCSSDIVTKVVHLLSRNVFAKHFPAGFDSECINNWNDWIEKDIKGIKDNKAKLIKDIKDKGKILRKTLCNILGITEWNLQETDLNFYNALNRKRRSWESDSCSTASRSSSSRFFGEVKVRAVPGTKNKDTAQRENSIKPTS